MKAAVDRTERFAEKRGALERIDAALRAGQVPLRAAEAIVFWIVGAVLLTIGATLLARHILAGVVILLIAMIIPPLLVKRRAAKYNKRFTAELPDMLQLLASTLRAGYSLMQGFEAVAREVDDGPVGEELDHLITESRLGRPMDEALKASAERVETDDWSWTVMAIQIQREVGGNLAELLVTVSETMIARERLRREVVSLTAEGRISAYMLGLMPLVLGVLMYVLNPEYIGLLFQRQIGWIAMGAAAVLMGCLLYTSPSPRDATLSRMPSSA